LKWGGLLGPPLFLLLPLLPSSSSASFCFLSLPLPSLLLLLLPLLLLLLLLFLFLLLVYRLLSCRAGLGFFLIVL